MCILDNNDRSISTETDAYYEAVASQEELYLEETEEEVHMILESYDPSSPQDESRNEQRQHAIEELLTGDSDDPPLSEELVDEIVDSSKYKRSS